MELQDTDTDALLPREGLPLPSQLWEVRVGAVYRRAVRGDWVWGINASFGSASNEPFQAGDAFSGTASGLLRIPHKKRNAWLFFLYFATNREFLNYVPLPGAGYWWEPSDKFRAVVGVPFASLLYEPIEKFSLDIRYFPVRNLRAKANLQGCQVPERVRRIRLAQPEIFPRRPGGQRRTDLLLREAGGRRTPPGLVETGRPHLPGRLGPRLVGFLREANAPIWKTNTIAVADSAYGTVKIGARF